MKNKVAKRKVLFTFGMNNDMFLIVTDASKSRIEEWIKSYLTNLENQQNSFLDGLKCTNYVRLLFDSELESDKDDVDIIGYDEVYDLNDYIKNTAGKLLK